MIRLWLLVCVVQSCFAGDLVFSGSLLRVGHESITIKLADRREIDARIPHGSPLTSEKIATQYKMGDQVEITGKSIPQIWEEETSRLQYLELTKLKFLGEPSSEELSQLLAARPSKDLVNLLSRPNLTVPAPGKMPTEIVPVVDPEAHARLEHAREINLDRVANLPNFIADEIGKRYSGDSSSSQWRPVDTIQSEVSFKGDRGSRQQVRRDGRKWDKPFQTLPGFKWSGGFGAEIKPLFDLQCPTSIDYDGHDEVNGKQLLKYRFSSPADGCFIPFYFEYQRYNPARTGYFYVDDPGGNVVKIEEDAIAFPAEFEFAQRTEHVTWDYVNIGGRSHLLPVSATFEVAYASGKRWRVDVEYKNHRHFESASNISFH